MVSEGVLKYDSEKDSQAGEGNIDVNVRGCGRVVPGWLGSRRDVGARSCGGGGGWEGLKQEGGGERS